MEGAPPPERPEFPPPSLQLQPAFVDGLTDAMGGDIVFVWNFLNCFGEGLGLPSTSVEALVDALALGQRSVLLSELHICLLRLLQSDMEEAHYNNSLQSGKVGGRGQQPRAWLDAFVCNLAVDLWQLQTG